MRLWEAVEITLHYFLDNTSTIGATLGSAIES